MRLHLLSGLLTPLSLAISTPAPNPESFRAAPITFNNPQEALFEATLFDKSNTTVRGWITAWAPPSGVGVKIHADFWGLPDNGPYEYHIHEEKIPYEGNCYKAGDHLDPYDRGTEPPCNPDNPATCQLGDVSGKHGPIFVAPDEPFETEFTDLFISTDENSPAFFGNRSLVVHAPDGSRLNCGNFIKVRH